MIVSGLETSSIWRNAKVESANEVRNQSLIPLFCNQEELCKLDLPNAHNTCLQHWWGLCKSWRYCQYCLQLANPSFQPQTEYHTGPSPREIRKSIHLGIYMTSIAGSHWYFCKENENSTYWEQVRQADCQHCLLDREGESNTHTHCTFWAGGGEKGEREMDDTLERRRRTGNRWMLF